MIILVYDFIQTIVITLMALVYSTNPLNNFLSVYSFFKILFFLFRMINTWAKFSFT